MNNLNKNLKPLIDAYTTFEKMRNQMERSVFGRNDGHEGEYSEVELVDNRPLGTINLILAALFSGGHLLLEDYPGTGKTYMIKILKDIIDYEIQPEDKIKKDYRRIQGVPDLMPGDITGYDAILNNTLIFQEGPIFCYVLLLDEINRTTPKVQSALLEAMAENQVTVGDKRRELGDFFFVVATQNPYDLVGTFPLPAAQLDRFLFKRKLVQVSDKVVEQIIFSDAPKKFDQVTRSQLIAAKIAISQVDANREVMGPYLVRLGIEFKKLTEPNENLEPQLEKSSKPSPRSLKGLLAALKVVALIRSGGDNGKLENLKVTPPLVRSIACDYFRHRIFPVNKDMNEEAREKLILDVINKVNKATGVAHKDS